MRQADYATTRIRIPLGEFGRYLRTGWWIDPSSSGADVEVKFNPWHDQATGRFTSGGAGDGSWNGGGFTGGGGNNEGWAGAGASSSWDNPAQPKAHSDPIPKSGASNRYGASIVRSAIAKAQTSALGRSVEQNGYSYQLDSSGRTTQVTGTLTLNPDQARSRSAQAAAGGKDRLATDDGGHYIAVRFNGPTDSFNHFAQDANFNRGGYRALESEWANDIKQGKTVWVKIVSKYNDSSQRPSSIRVTFTVNGVLSERDFHNAPKGKHHGK